MKNTLFLFSLVVCGSAQAGYFSNSDPGTTSGQFLKLGAGARATALGEAYSAVADDASALYWNPAGLALIPGASLTFMHAAYVDSSFYDYAAFAQTLGNWGSVGVGGQFLSLGKITQTDAAGTDLGSFNPNDMAISLGYAHALAGGALGFSAKLIRETILNTAQAKALDVGLLSPGLWEDRLRLALVATNLGGQLKFEQEGADLPRTLRAGSRVKFSGSFIAALDGVFPNDNAPYAALGTEYRLRFSEQLEGALRAGFNARSFGDLNGLSGVSMGLGLAFGSFSADYALQTLGPLGLTHRFSLSLKWGEAPYGAKAKAQAAPSGWLGNTVSAP